jgi:uncharacterized coiled-coil protein SlyX
LREIAALELAIAKDNAYVTELEGMLVQKRHDVQVVSVEVRILKHAASLRPIVQAAEIQVPVPPAATPAAEAQPGRFRNIVAQIRTSDPRLSHFPGG